MLLVESRQRAIPADHKLDVCMGKVRGADPLRVCNFYGMNDRLHFSALGHHTIARTALAALNVPNDLKPLDPPPLPQQNWRQARKEDVVWAKEHLVPWVIRRLRHESSGDNIVAKRPEPGAVKSVD